MCVYNLYGFSCLPLAAQFELGIPQQVSRISPFSANEPGLLSFSFPVTLHVPRIRLGPYGVVECLPEGQSSYTPLYPTLGSSTPLLYTTTHDPSSSIIPYSSIHHYYSFNPRHAFCPYPSPSPHIIATHSHATCIGYRINREKKRKQGEEKR